MDGADPHGPQLLTPHWPVDVPTEGSGPGQPRLGSPWRTLPTTQVPERSGTRGGEQAGPVSPSSPPGPGLTKHSPRGSPGRAWEQAGGQPSFQSSRPGTTGRAAGLPRALTSPGCTAHVGPPGENILSSGPALGQEAQKWTHLFQLASWGKARPRRSVQSSVGS